MKKILLFLLLGIVPQLIHAQTAKAIWCSGNTTLYFTYDTNTYAAGGTYEGQAITDVYAINANGYEVYVLEENYDYADEAQYDDEYVIPTTPWASVRRSVTNVVIAANFSSFTPTSFSCWFYGFHNLTTIVGSNYINTSNATSTNRMFAFCESLTSLDLGNWDVSHVTDMGWMFRSCYCFSSLDVSKWDVSSVINMEYMFNDMGFDGGFTSLDVSNWDVSSVTTMESMFSIYYLTSLDLSNWDVSSVRNMRSMFGSCYNLTSVGDVSNWDVSSVTTMERMFGGCESLTSLDVSNWNVSSVRDMNRMFSSCWYLTSLDVSKWDVSSVRNMREMFSGCWCLTSLDVSNWDVSNAVDYINSLRRMFMDCKSLTSLDLSKWNNRNHWDKDIGSMFENCENLARIIFGKDFVIYSSNMAQGVNANTFRNCARLRYIDFYDCDPANIRISFENMIGDRLTPNTMFYEVPATTVIYLPHGSQEVTDKPNVVYSYNGDENDLRCPEYYSVDKDVIGGSSEYINIELPRDFKTHKAIYTRTMANNYGSVILPYDFTTNDSVRAYTLDEERTETMYFRDTQTVPAHTPFAFNVKQKGAENVVDFTMADSDNNFGITVKATHTTHPDETGWDGVAGAPYSSNTNLTGWTAKGYYVNQTIEKTDPLYGDLHYIAGEKFYKAAGETLKFPPHRVTFHGTWAKGNPSAGAKSFVFAASDDEVITAIEEAETRQTLRDAEAIYDLAGRRQHEAQKGVNIVRMKDGSVRKMFVK